MKPFCIGCNRTPDQIDEYVECAAGWFAGRYALDGRRGKVPWEFSPDDEP